MFQSLRKIALVLPVLLLTAGPAAAQSVHLAVIVGLSGDPEHAKLFQRWASTLVDAASGRMAIPKDRIVYLTERPEEDAKRSTGKSTREEITRAFAALATHVKPDDVVFVVLIGHGTFDGKTAKFNLPGPDMTPADFALLLKNLKVSQVVFVNTASSSGPFLAELSGPGRTIVTATRSGAERFATLFGGYFVDAFASDTADADKNRRVSVLEAFDAAKHGVARAYEQAGTMITEHPLLDDSGDKQGAADPRPDGKNGRIAAVLSLGAVSSGEKLPDDPKVRALYEERSELERRVEGLKLMKTGMEPARYATELEKLLTELALKGQQIRNAEGKR
jgi:Peptidase C13 family